MQIHVLIFALLVRKTVPTNRWDPKLWYSESTPMAWVDEKYRVEDHYYHDENAVVDTFFDRLVSIQYDDPENEEDKRYFNNVATGVYITSRLVLTSFNAFRSLSRREDTRSEMTVYSIVSRYFANATSQFPHRLGYVWHTRNVLCARQVIPYKDEEVPPHMRHGLHVPLHDLMVMRMHRNVTFRSPPPETLHSFKDHYANQKYWGVEEKSYVIGAGPIQVDLAKPEDKLEGDMKFASLGHVSDDHIEARGFLELGVANEGDVTECDEWFPRSWGHFICVTNVNNYVGVASGGMLFSDDKLFGVGSFALFRRKRSVLVFTDVRKYWHLLHQTCTETDQKLEIPEWDDEP